MYRSIIGVSPQLDAMVTYSLLLLLLLPALSSSSSSPSSDIAAIKDLLVSIFSRYESEMGQLRASVTALADKVDEVERAVKLGADTADRARRRETWTRREVPATATGRGFRLSRLIVLLLFVVVAESKVAEALERLEQLSRHRGEDILV